MLKINEASSTATTVRAFASILTTQCTEGPCSHHCVAVPSLKGPRLGKKTHWITHTDNSWAMLFRLCVQTTPKPLSSKNLNVVCHCRKAAHWPHAALPRVWTRTAERVRCTRSSNCLRTPVHPLQAVPFVRVTVRPVTTCFHPISSSATPPSSDSKCPSETSGAHRMCSTLPMGWIPHRSILCLHSWEYTFCYGQLASVWCATFQLPWCNEQKEMLLELLNLNLIMR